MKVKTLLALFFILFSFFACGPDTENGPNSNATPNPEPPQVVSIKSLKISGPPLLKKGDTANFSATCFYTDGTSKSVANVNWSADNPNLVNMSSAGVLKVGDVVQDTIVTVTVSYSEADKTVTAVFKTFVIIGQTKIYGIDFGPFEGEQDPGKGSVLSEVQLRNKMSVVAPFVVWIRTFRSTAGLENAGKIAHEFGLKTVLGAELTKDLEANKKEMDSLITSAKAGYVDLAVVGSEVLRRKDLTETQLIDYINQFRLAVPNVQVTTGETYNILFSHPNLIAACDFVFANFYPYWEGVDVANAMADLSIKYNALVDISGGKEVIISEVGWPSAGDKVGSAVASLVNANFYFLNFVSWATAKNVKYFYFEAFDEPYKINYEGAAGPNWGLFDSDNYLKNGMEAVFDGKVMTDNWSTTPKFSITSIGANLSGRAENIYPEEYRVVAYIKVKSGWWVKPYYSYPLTVINPDGTWVCDITTGGQDDQATEVLAFLVKASYSPPISGGGALDIINLTANSIAQIDKPIVH